MNTVSDDIIIKKAENINAAGYSKIPDLMQLTIDVLNPNKILHNQHLPALECEMSGLALSAKITQKKATNQKPKTLKDQLHKINENSDIQKTILQADENGELNTKSRTKIISLLNKPDYKNLPDEGRQELISKWLSLNNQSNDLYKELLAFASAKYNLNEKSVETSVNIVIELIKNLTNKLDTINTTCLSDELSSLLHQELRTLQDKIKYFIKKHGTSNI